MYLSITNNLFTLLLNFEDPLESLDKVPQKKPELKDFTLRNKLFSKYLMDQFYNELNDIIELKQIKTDYDNNIFIELLNELINKIENSLLINEDKNKIKNEINNLLKELDELNNKNFKLCNESIDIINEMVNIHNHININTTDYEINHAINQLEELILKVSNMDKNVFMVGEEKMLLIEINKIINEIRK